MCIFHTKSRREFLGRGRRLQESGGIEDEDDFMERGREVGSNRGMWRIVLIEDEFE